MSSATEKEPTNVEVPDMPASGPAPAEEHRDEPASAALEEHPDARSVPYKVAALNFTVFLAGVVDASLGPLIPYLQPAYNINLTRVAIIYLINFCGWTTAAFTVVHINAHLNTGGTLILGAGLQLLAHTLQFWNPPFPLFAITYFFSGIGLAFQDAQANAFISNLKYSHRWLGILHAIYGVGALISPLVATAIASNRPDQWHYFYLLPFGLGVLNLLFLVATFRELVRGNSKAQKDAATGQLKDTLRNKVVLLLGAFFFIYVGTEVTAGGWIVEFLIKVRRGAPGRVGYVASGFWGGLTAGRVLLAEPTYRFGEQRMTVLYLLLSAVSVAIFWAVDSVIVSSVMISLFGFVIGPFYPTGISIVQQLIPRDGQVAAIAMVASVGQAGSAAFPFLTGAVADSQGVGVLRGMLVALVGAMSIIWVLVPGVPGRGKWWAVERPEDKKRDVEEGSTEVVQN